MNYRSAKFNRSQNGLIPPTLGMQVCYLWLPLQLQISSAIKPIQMMTPPVSNKTDELLLRNSPNPDTLINSVAATGIQAVLRAVPGASAEEDAGISRLYLSADTSVRFNIRQQYSCSAELTVEI